MSRVSSRAGRVAVALLPALAACAPSAPAPGIAAPSATTAAVTATDLRTRLGIFADDSMMGRGAGTAGNAKGTAYLAAEAGRLGLVPAGESGTFFQTVPLVKRTLAPGAAVSAGGTTFAPSTDFIARDQGKATRPIDGVPVVDGGVFGDSAHPALPADQAAGKLVVIRVAPQPDGTPAGTVARAVVTERFGSAAGIAVATLDAIAPADRAGLEVPSAQLAHDGGPAQPAFLYVTARMAEALVRAGTVRGSVAFADSPPDAPARNVVAILPGSDPALRGQLVALGAHNDHLPMAPAPAEHDSLRAFNAVMRPKGADDSPGTPTAAQHARIRAILDSLRRLRPARQDSVFNGADDDGSGSVTLLEIAEALARSPRHPKRSLLFVWHTGEEVGLLGSDWFTRHPTVARDSIVAQLNVDMVGRGGAADLAEGGPAYLRMIGSRRLSTELGNLVEQVNADGKHGFALDYRWDAKGHPDNSYCRSDHYMYARYGIPIAFFTTGSHRDYHQLTDEVQYIDFGKMARVADFIEQVAVRVADLDHRVVVDQPKPDPEGSCRQ
ncbi:MAG TPA: M28 family peptidase [Gemmatimonadales bacterium]|nr:M28 family peptidase [Gemmatimonadales bacterium]